MRRKIIALLLFFLVINMCLAQQEEEIRLDDPSTWTADFVMTHQAETFNIDPDRAVQLYPIVLNDFYRAEQYFSSNPIEMNVYKIQAQNYLERYTKGSSFIISGYIADFNPEAGSITTMGIPGNTRLSYANIYNYPEGCMFKINRDGSLDVKVPGYEDIKISGKNVVYNEHEGDNLGTFDIDEGYINGRGVVGGKQISMDNKGNIKYGIAQSFGGVEFNSEEEFSYNKEGNTLIPVETFVINKVKEPITIKSFDVGVIWIDKKIKPDDKGVLNYGSVSYGKCDSGCKVIRIGDSYINSGFEFKGRQIEANSGTFVNFYYNSEKPESDNYLHMGENFDDFKGKDFFVRYEEGNNLFSMIPNDKVQDALGAGMTREIQVYPKGGRIKIERVTNENQEVSLHVRAEGDYELRNGEWRIISEDEKVYSRLTEPSTDKGNILVGTDMRIEQKQGDKVRIFDFNAAKRNIRFKTKEEIDFNKAEVAKINELKEYLEKRKLKANKDEKILKEDETLDYQEVYSYLNNQISELEKEYEFVYPVFGEVITVGDVNVRGSSFFNAPLTRTKDADIKGGNYKGAALIIVSKHGERDVAFDIAGRVSGKELAQKGNYVLYLENEVRDYPHFFEILKNPNLESIQPELKINTIEINSHMWAIEGSSGSSIGYESGIHHEPIELDLGNNYRDLLDAYYKYLSRGRVRSDSLETLPTTTIQLIKNNLAPDAEIRYNGCWAGKIKPGSISVQTHDIFGVRVKATPVGTYVQEFDPKNKVWTAYELDENGNYVYALDGNGEVKIGGGIKVRKENKVGEGDTARLWPNLDLLKEKEIQDLYPGIVGYLTITDSKEKKGHKFYEIEYPKDDGTKNSVWLTENGRPVNELIMGDNPINDKELVNFRPEVLSSNQLSGSSINGVRSAYYDITAYMEDLEIALDIGTISQEQRNREIGWGREQQNIYVSEEALRTVRTRPTTAGDLVPLESFNLNSDYRGLRNYRNNLEIAYYDGRGRLGRNMFQRENQWVEEQMSRYRGEVTARVSTRPGTTSDLISISRNQIINQYRQLRNYWSNIGIAYNFEIFSEERFEQESQWVEGEVNRYESETGVSLRDIR